VRELAARSPKLTIAVAAAVVFLAAMLIGRALFAPEPATAEPSRPDPARTAGPTPPGQNPGGAAQPKNEETKQQRGEDEDREENGDGAKDD